MNFLFARIKEPSTWTAIGAIGFMFGLPPGTIDAVHGVFVGLAALGGIFLPERSSTPAP